MYIYILIVLVIIIFYNKINTNKINLYDWIVIIFLTLICGLRENVGTDYSLYRYYYYNIEDNSRFEIAFKSIIEFLNHLGISYNVFLLIISMLTIFLFYFAIKKYSKKPAASIFYFITLGYYAYSFNIIRQMLAIAITLIGIKYIKEKNFLKYLIVILIASSFHLTALLMIPAYFLLNLKNNRRNNLLLLGICVTIPFLYTRIFNFVVTNFEQYSMYATINDYTFIKPGLGTYIVGFVNVILYIIMFLKRKKINDIDEMNNNYFKLFSYSLVFTGLSFANSVAVRGGYYLSIYLIFLLPDLGKILFNKENKEFEILMMLAFFVYYCVHLISFNEMIPYNSIL